MKSLFLFCILCCFLGCNLQGHKLVRKKIRYNNVIIRWYFYCAITDTSPDIVEAEKNGNIKEIYQATRVIIDVTIRHDSIIVKTVPPYGKDVVTKKIPTDIFGYKVKLDSTASFEEINVIPLGEKE